MSHKRAASYDAFNSQPNPNYDLDVTHRIFLILPLSGSDLNVPYSPNQFLGLDFCRFLQQDSSSLEGRSINLISFVLCT